VSQWWKFIIMECWATTFELWQAVSYVLEEYAVSISWYQEIDV